MAALLFISFIVLLLIGVPVAFAIAAAALLVLLKGDVKLLILVQRMFASTDSFSLIAVPFFIFAGDLLAKGKVSRVLVEFAESLLGMLKGGLSIVSVLAGILVLRRTTSPGRSFTPISLNPSSPSAPTIFCAI